MKKWSQRVSIFVLCIGFVLSMVSCSSNNNGLENNESGKSKDLLAPSDDPMDYVNASIDWKKYGGTQLRAVFNEHFFTDRTYPVISAPRR